MTLTSHQRARTGDKAFLHFPKPPKPQGNLRKTGKRGKAIRGPFRTSQTIIIIVMPEPRPHKRLRRQITETSTEGDEDGSGDYATLDHDTIEVKSQPESHHRSVFAFLTLYSTVPFIQQPYSDFIFHLSLLAPLATRLVIDGHCQNRQTGQSHYFQYSSSLQ